MWFFFKIDGEFEAAIRDDKGPYKFSTKSIENKPTSKSTSSSTSNSSSSSLKSRKSNLADSDIQSTVTSIPSTNGGSGKKKKNQ